MRTNLKAEESKEVMRQVSAVCNDLKKRTESYEKLDPEIGSNKYIDDILRVLLQHKVITTDQVKPPKDKI